MRLSVCLFAFEMGGDKGHGCVKKQQRACYEREEVPMFFEKLRDGMDVLKTWGGGMDERGSLCVLKDFENVVMAVPK